MNLEIKDATQIKETITICYIKNGVTCFLNVPIDHIISWGCLHQHDFNPGIHDTIHEWVIKDNEIQDIDFLTKFVAFIISKEYKDPIASDQVCYN